MVKSNLHSNNKFRNGYNFDELITVLPNLKECVFKNKYGNDSIDFFDRKSVQCLNQALLLKYYGIKDWTIPEDYLCPPIPGRLDYILYASDLLAERNFKKVPKGNKIHCLDIGMGASCIYPILGNKEFQWSFVGTDIDKASLENAHKIIHANPSLSEQIVLRHQENINNILYGVIKESELFDLVVCNPPFHKSLQEAKQANLRKTSNLKGKKVNKPTLNFGGQSNELWYNGGELSFITKMIDQSRAFAKSCLWFTSLVSKESNLKLLIRTMDKFKVPEVKIVPMGQGNKKSRFIAWTFLNDKQQKAWVESRFF